jgi:hypothetical protein
MRKKFALRCANVSLTYARRIKLLLGGGGARSIEYRKEYAQDLWFRCGEVDTGFCG